MSSYVQFKYLLELFDGLMSNDDDATRMELLNTAQEKNRKLRETTMKNMRVKEIAVEEIELFDVIIGITEPLQTAIISRNDIYTSIQYTEEPTFDLCLKVISEEEDYDIPHVDPESPYAKRMAELLKSPETQEDFDKLREKFLDSLDEKWADNDSDEKKIKDDRAEKDRIQTAEIDKIKKWYKENPDAVMTNQLIKLDEEILWDILLGHYEKNNITDYPVELEDGKMNMIKELIKLDKLSYKKDAWKTLKKKYREMDIEPRIQWSHTQKAMEKEIRSLENIHKPLDIKEKKFKDLYDNLPEEMTDKETIKMCDKIERAIARRIKAIKKSNRM